MYARLGRVSSLCYRGEWAEVQKKHVVQTHTLFFLGSMFKEDQELETSILPNSAQFAAACKLSTVHGVSQRENRGSQHLACFSKGHPGPSLYLLGLS